MKEVSTRERFNMHNKINSQPIMDRAISANEMKSKERIYTLLIILGMTLFMAGVVALVWIYCQQNAVGAEVDIIGAEGADITQNGGVKIGSFYISTASLAIIVGGIVALIGILKGRKIQLNADGSVIVN